MRLLSFFYHYPFTLFFHFHFCLPFPHVFEFVSSGQVFKYPRSNIGSWFYVGCMLNHWGRHYEWKRNVLLFWVCGRRWSLRLARMFPELTMVWAILLALRWSGGTVFWSRNSSGPCTCTAVGVFWVIFSLYHPGTRYVPFYRSFYDIVDCILRTILGYCWCRLLFFLCCIVIGLRLYLRTRDSSYASFVSSSVPITLFVLILSLLSKSPGGCCVILDSFLPISGTNTTRSNVICYY